MTKSSFPISFTVPPELKALLEVVPETGYYDSLSEFIRDAIRGFLKAEKGLKIAIVKHLYTAKKISLGKAAELLGASIKEAETLLKHMVLK